MLLFKYGEIILKFIKS